MARHVLMLRNAIASSLLVLTAACAAEERPASEAPFSSDASTDGVASIDTSVPAPFPVPDDETCEFVAFFAHPDPDSLISEFLRRDASGQFLQTSDWFAGATMCPGHEPGPDFYTVVEGYEVASLERMSSRVGVVVTAPRVGYLWFSRGLEADPGTDVDTMFAVLTSHGWRIVSPALRLRIPASVARQRGDLPQEQGPETETMNETPFSQR